MTIRDDGTPPDAISDEISDELLRISGLPEHERQPALKLLLDANPGSAEAILAQFARDQDIARTTAPDVSARIPPRFAQLGPYRVGARLGRGSMGVVYLGTLDGEQDAKPPTRVALKIMAQGTEDAEANGRFMREMVILRGLEHPGIAKLIHSGMERDGALLVPWYAMELVEGGLPLVTYADEHQLEPTKRLSLFLSLCETMAYLHSERVVHRDLKPNNVLVSAAGEVKVIDFGIARVVGNALRLTQTQLVPGTPRYMSPERGASSDADPRTDVWALGVMLCELIGGDAAFDDRARRAQLAGTVPPALAAIVGCCLERDPTRRYQDAGKLADDVRAVLDGRRPWAMTRRWRRTAALAALVSGAVAVCVAVPVFAGRRSVVDAMRGASELLQAGRYDEVRAKVQPVRDASWAARFAGQIADSNIVREIKLPIASSRMRRPLGTTQAMLLGKNGQVTSFDLHTGTPLPKTLEVPPAVCGFDLTSSGHLMAVSIQNGDVSLRTADAVRWTTSLSPDAAANPTAAPNKVRPSALVVDRRGRFVVVAEPDGTLRLLAGDDGRGIASTTDGLGRPADLALNTDGDWLAVAYVNGVIGMHRLSEGPSWLPAAHLRSGEAKALASLQPLSSVVFDATGKHILTAGNRGRVVAYSCTGGESWSEAKVFDGIAGDARVAAFSPDGTLVAALASDACVCVWRWQDRALLAVSPASATGSGSDLAFVGDGALMWLDGTDRARFWAPAVLGGTRMQGHAVTAWKARVSPNGKMIASVGNDERVCLWDANSRAGLLTYRGHTDRVLDCAWSPDSATVATASSDHTIRLWSVVRRAPGPVLRGHEEQVSAILYSSDGQSLLSASIDGTVRRWDLRRGADRVLHDVKKKVHALATTTDRRVIVVGCKDGTVLRCQEGRPAETVCKLDGVVTCLAFDGAGRQLAAATEKGSVLITMPAGRVVRLQDGPVWSVRFDPSSQELISGDEAGAIRTWQPDGTNLLTWSPSRTRAPVMHVEPFDGGVLVATASGSILEYGSLSVLSNTLLGSELSALARGWRRQAVLSADAARLVASSPDIDPQLRVALDQRLTFEGDDPDVMAKDAHQLAFPHSQPRETYQIALQKLDFAEANINPKRKGSFFRAYRALALYRLERFPEVIAELDKYTDTPEPAAAKDVDLYAAFLRAVAHQRMRASVPAEVFATRFRALLAAPGFRTDAEAQALSEEMDRTLRSK